MAVVEMPYIDVDEKGVARIAGSNMKVRLLIEEYLNWACSAQEIREHHPELTLSQIHATLAYYYENKKTLDAEIAAARQFAEDMRAKAGPSPIAERLRRDGLIK